MKKKVILSLFVVLLIAELFYGYFGLWRGEHFYHGCPMSCLSNAKLLDLLWSEDKELSTHAILGLVQPVLASGMIPGSQTRALTIVSDGSKQIVVILQIRDAHRLLDDAYHVVLMDQSGAILDRISASLNNRSPCEVAEVREHNSTQIIVRNPILGAYRHCWYSITYCGREYKFESGLFPPLLSPAELEHWGLCRIAVQDDKFNVLFPKLDDAHQVRPGQSPYPIQW
jgi:hypothetical protein